MVAWRPQAMCPRPNAQVNVDIGVKSRRRVTVPTINRGDYTSHMAIEVRYAKY
jgi:hypothetical protein